MKEIEWVVGNTYLTRDGREVVLTNINPDGIYQNKFYHDEEPNYRFSVNNDGRECGEYENESDIIKLLKSNKEYEKT